MRSLRPFATRAGAIACLLAATAAAPAASARVIEPAGSASEVEPPITLPGVEGDYLRTLHVRIHWRWAHKFIEDVAQTRPPTDPINNPALQAEVLFTVRWDGSPAEVTLSKSSGVPAFDQAAVVAVRGEDMTYPVPPLELYGDDGVAHFRWSFARDHRLCSDGEVRRREESLETALPRLFVQGRTKEALLRVVRYMRSGQGGAMSVFARAWLARRFTDPTTDARAAAALARAGDRRQVDRLRPALARPDTVAIAAPALAALKVDLCALVRPSLAAGDAKALALGTRALRESGAELAAGSPCLEALGALAKDPAQAGAARADAIDALAVTTPGGVRRLALAALDDPDPHVRAAGARAFARPGGGRPTLYRLQPLLGDHSPEVRAAVAAGLVRACGDLSYDYLQPLFKEADAQPLLAMAPELGRQPSARSTELLARMLKRPAPELRMVVMTALAGRRDAPARALFRPLADAIKKDQRASAEARLTAYAGADADELAPMARDPVIGVAAFKALLRARRHQEAADWLVASFDRLPPETLVDAFSAWLANPAPGVAATSLPHQ